MAKIITGILCITVIFLCIRAYVEITGTTYPWKYPGYCKVCSRSLYVWQNTISIYNPSPSFFYKARGEIKWHAMYSPVPVVVHNHCWIFCDKMLFKSI